MARLPRVDLVDVPQHIIQRGNNRQICFAEEQDFAAYCRWLKEYSEKFAVEVHAWVLMTNHVHLLCTPRKPKAISLMMQSIGRRYVQYFNLKYKRSGTLWEGRYKSSLIQAETYLLHVYRYIELNPLRAGMVKEPGDYEWSSYQINCLGKESKLCTPHSIYLALGQNKTQRLKVYAELCKQYLSKESLIDIRQALNKGMALGSDRFKREVESLTGRRVTEGKRGRPCAGDRKSNNEIQSVSDPI